MEIIRSNPKDIDTLTVHHAGGHVNTVLRLADGI